MAGSAHRAAHAMPAGSHAGCSRPATHAHAPHASRTHRCATRDRQRPPTAHTIMLMRCPALSCTTFPSLHSTPPTHALDPLIRTHTALCAPSGPPTPAHAHALTHTAIACQCHSCTTPLIMQHLHPPNTTHRPPAHDLTLHATHTRPAAPACHASDAHDTPTAHTSGTQLAFSIHAASCCCLSYYACADRVVPNPL